MRGRTRATLAAGLTSLALVATACGGGGTTHAGHRGRWPDRRRGHRRRLHAGEPAGPRQHDRGLWRRHRRRHDVEAGGVQHRERRATERHRRVDRDHATTRPSPSSSSRTSSTTAPKSRPRASSTPGTTPPTDPTVKRAATSWRPIAGYADVQCPDDDCKQTAEGQDDVGPEGRRRQDLHHHRPRSRCPTSPVRLGYSAYRPAAGRPSSPTRRPSRRSRSAPGQFKVDSISNTEIVLSKFAEFSGANKANVDKLTFRIYQDPAAAYADAVAGSLDYIDDSNIPPDQLVGEAYKNDFPDRTSQKESLVNGWITFSPERSAAGGGGQRREAQGHLAGHRPRPDRQADLQRHPHPGHRLGVSERGRLQGRRLR